MSNIAIVIGSLAMLPYTQSLSGYDRHLGLSPPWHLLLEVQQEGHVHGAEPGAYHLRHPVATSTLGPQRASGEPN